MRSAGRLGNGESMSVPCLVALLGVASERNGLEQQRCAHGICQSAHRPRQRGSVAHARRTRSYRPGRENRVRIT
jgi:hypothetical protein